ncbi:MAG: 50S ribosomal protein L6 [Patescibacteria group bacterium]|nr:50S ribosomal protein L6 [Patescibacteria group bacterium]MBU1160635.1 50S ribosomal protein L6 [Patescibacteria group bacterium]MBU1349987.1 50S ribosomal protein L6 [Patescibacteria group bacterium]MBU1421442.1 50S ribosomal protein L6 [Patescibacteria group bacterium]MBU1684173.1 50S ribosomal protein L6 [Patescibacteria group bacterium]
MSRIGKLPIELIEGTQAKIEDGFIVVKGPKGELKQKINSLVNVKIDNNQIIISVDNIKDKNKKALWGLFRSLINNMVIGVTQGFEKKLEINGVGYKASASGSVLTLNVGFSHPVEYNLLDGISASVEKNIITINGIDKQLVGETAAQIRKVRKPEPYKGKGIKYVDEVIRRKAGKTAAKGE